jgi:hypothetical protein
MKFQNIRTILRRAAFFTLLVTLPLLAFNLFAWQAPPTSSTAPASTRAPNEQLKISAHAHHEDLLLKVADLKAMPRTTVTVHNEHSKRDETYSTATSQ